MLLFVHAIVQANLYIAMPLTQKVKCIILFMICAFDKQWTLYAEETRLSSLAAILHELITIIWCVHSNTCVTVCDFTQPKKLTIPLLRLCGCGMQSLSTVTMYRDCKTWYVCLNSIAESLRHQDRISEIIVKSLANLLCQTSTIWCTIYTVICREPIVIYTVGMRLSMGTKL